MGTRAAVLLLVFGLLAAACQSRIYEPGSAATDPQAVGRHTADERADADASVRSTGTSDPDGANGGSGGVTTGANGDNVSVATNLNQATNFGNTTIRSGSAGSALNIAIGNDGASAVVVGDQTANGAHISVGGSSVSVISHVSASSSVSVTSSSTASGGSSVVNVSVTTGSGTVNRTVRFDGPGRFVLRVTAEGDGPPVIQVEEVGP